MDINEVTTKKINRHPWELSRTQSLLAEWVPYIDSLGEQCTFLDIGAGDMYFDKHILQLKKGHRLYAVDLGYDTEKLELVKCQSERIKMYKELRDVEADLQVDYALMLDSIEYMPDEVQYITDLAAKVRSGGYIFFAMPAYQFLFSQHDVIVKLLRRYNRKEFADIIRQVEEVEIINAHYFYMSLFFVRLMQKLSRADIDPEHKVTTGWPYSKKSIVTRAVKGVLDFDYMMGRLLGKLGIMLPGLSLMVICKKD